MGRKTQNKKRFKHNIRNSTYKTIPYIEHLCFFFGGGERKGQANIYYLFNIYLQ